VFHRPQLEFARQMPYHDNTIQHFDNINTTKTINDAEETLMHSTSFVAECNMPTPIGNFRMRSYIYSSPRVCLEPIVMIYGNVPSAHNYDNDNAMYEIEKMSSSEFMINAKCLALLDVIVKTN